MFRDDRGSWGPACLLLGQLERIAYRRPRRQALTAGCSGQFEQWHSGPNAGDISAEAEPHVPDSPRFWVFPPLLGYRGMARVRHPSPLRRLMTPNYAPVVCMPSFPLFRQTAAGSSVAARTESASDIPLATRSSTDLSTLGSGESNLSRIWYSQLETHAGHGRSASCTLNGVLTQAETW